jgi:hypothetical protein
MYDLVLITDWNRAAPVPGRGSAIFLHRWRRPGAPTAGCIALAPGDLLWLARRIRPGQGLLIRGQTSFQNALGFVISPYGGGTPWPAPHPLATT